MEIDLQKQLESKVASLLTNEGKSFSVPSRSILRYLSKKKERTFTLSHSCLGTLDLLTYQYLKIDFDRDKLKANPIAESNVVVSANNKRMAKIVAIAWLNGLCYLPILPIVFHFTNWPLIWIFSRYFHSRLTSSRLFDITIAIREQMNTEDFINSIVLMTGIQRTTEPKADPIEEKTRED